MDEENQEDVSPLEAVAEEDTEEEVQSPLSALDPVRAELLRQSKAAEGRLSKLSQSYINQIEEAKRKLLAQPTELSRKEMLRAIASKLTKRPVDERDPRFWERQNIFTMLRDIGELGGEVSAAEKKLKAEQEAKVADLEGLRTKYMLGEATRGASQAASALARYRPPSPQKLSTKAQEIIDLENLANDETKSEVVRSRARYRLDKINQEIPEEDRSVLGQHIRARRMLNSKDPEERAAARSFLTKGGNLTLPRVRKDTIISDARKFLETVDEKERAAAFANPFPTERQRQIIEAVRVSREPMYSEIAAQGGFSAELIEDEGEE